MIYTRSQRPAELDSMTEAALRAFRSRHRHRCGGCGKTLLFRDEVVRVDGEVYHLSCRRPVEAGSR